MAIVLIIVIGLVLMTAAVGFFDVMGKRAIAAGSGTQLKERIDALEHRLIELEQGTIDRDETIQRLEGEISFLTNLLGKGTERATLPGPK